MPNQNKLIEQHVPPITHPHGAYWRQPPREQILIDNEFAVMTEAAFEQLAEYSRSEPSGVYAGKMWKCLAPSGWYLRWYEETDVLHRFYIKHRLILLVKS